MRRNVITSVVVIMVVAVLLFVLLKEAPQVAWNSGSRDQLATILKTIGNKVAIESDEAELTSFVAAFNPKSSMGVDSNNSKKLIEQHGLTTNWNVNGSYRPVLFYPIAVNDNIAIGQDSSDTRQPLLVMVPLDDSDKTNLPYLHGCANVISDRLLECQLLRIRDLCRLHDIEHVASLMSDGSIEFLDVGSLEQEGIQAGNSSR